MLELVDAIGVLGLQIYRIDVEEKLLRENFSATFADYTTNVLSTRITRLVNVRNTPRVIRSGVQPVEGKRRCPMFYRRMLEISTLVVELCPTTILTSRSTRRQCKGMPEVRDQVLFRLNAH